MTTKVFLMLSLTVTAISNVTSAQSTAPSASTGSAVPLPLQPMPIDAKPALEVATIKPSDTSAPHGRFIRHNGRQIIAYNMALGDLISYAYGLQAKQIVDAPPSLFAMHFDIDGVPDIDGHR